MRATVSVLGLGRMGRAMARVLAAAAWEVRGWNRSPLAEEVTAGVSLCSTIEEAAQSDVCLMMVSDAAAVAAVLAELEPHLRPGQLVLDMGTSDPEQSKEHARRLARRGIGWVDAPVSGGPEGAAAATLAIMAGGTAEDFGRARPILAALGSNVVHVGGPGMGHAVKVINQLIVGLVIEAVAEGLTLAEKVGIDPALVQQALRGGFGDSKILQIHGTRMIERRYAPGAQVQTQLKDLYLARAMAAAGARLPHLESIIEFYEALAARGEESLDHSALHKLLWE